MGGKKKPFLQMKHKHLVHSSLTLMDVVILVCAHEPSCSAMHARTSGGVLLYSVIICHRNLWIPAGGMEADAEANVASFPRSNGLDGFGGGGNAAGRTLTRVRKEP